MKNNDEEIYVGDIEVNSGVDFPGETLENLVETDLTCESKRARDGIIVVEIGIPNFQFKFKK